MHYTSTVAGVSVVSVRKLLTKYLMTFFEIGVSGSLSQELCPIYTTFVSS
jgi:hypothetical protein